MILRAQCLAWLLFVIPAVDLAPGDSEYFAITVVDSETGRGVPLVELETVNGIRFVTDSDGVAAINEPGLMGQSVFFRVTSHGYEFPKDGFGFRGKAFQLTPGNTATIQIQRTNVAERLYRVTGGGIYRDSRLIGNEIPIVEPLLNAKVLGSDSVVSALFGGKVHWFWGDTNRPRYPLGNFHVPGATSELPANGGLSPNVGVDLRYFVGAEGFAKETAKMPGSGPTWIDSLIVLNDDGRERMFAHYVKVKPPLTVYRHGLAEFNPKRQEFEQVLKFPDNAAVYPSGHPFLFQDEGIEYVYFAKPFPLTRVPATIEAIQDLDQYESFTCLKEGSSADLPQLDRRADGALRYGWKRRTPPLSAKLQAEFKKGGLLQDDEIQPRLIDVETGDLIAIHGGSVYFNEYRNRWLLIGLQSFGTSLLGEIWYAEADSPLGPWGYARKIVTHHKYSFYNPKQHPFFASRGGRTIYFEGTYTTLFSGNEHKTPRYDYNQIMYRLNLDDQRVTMPVPVYRHGRQLTMASTGMEHVSSMDAPVAFFAMDRESPFTVPVHATRGDAQPLFYGISNEQANSFPMLRPLYEYRNEIDGQTVLSIDAGWAQDGFERTDEPLCQVWENPVQQWPVTGE